MNKSAALDIVAREWYNILAQKNKTQLMGGRVRTALAAELLRRGKETAVEFRGNGHYGCLRRERTCVAKVRMLTVL